MLASLWDNATARKLRLFSAACCRSAWPAISNDDWRNAIETSERFADGQADNQDLLAARRPLLSASWDTSACLVVTAADDEVSAPLLAILVSERVRREYKGDQKEIAVRQTTLLRDIVGNPFRPVTIDPAWLTTTVVSLAQAIYEQRAFDRLPILADALEDAGCDSSDILTHCQQPGEHVRGCWAVDLMLNQK